MFKRIFTMGLVCIMTFSVIGCEKENDEKKSNAKTPPQYETQEFEISGYWAPYDISEEGLKQYKDAGLNTLLMINHSGERNSEEQFYLGSERTMNALKLCRKLGLKAILNYDDWIAQTSEEQGTEYYGETPFSKHDVYGEYRDIISGIHICDEPKFDPHFAIYGNEMLINDFKKVYPNANYVVNLIPIYGAPYYGFESNQDMMDKYGETFMRHFEKPYISVDIYPFHTNEKDVDMQIVTNHKAIAETAKKYNAEKTFILQSSAGAEFEEDLCEGDMRWQVYAALAFGADNLCYYCYSVPKGREYNYCILNADNTPSKMYYFVKEINNEIQSFASAFLAYDWDKSIGVSGSVDQTFRVSPIEYDDMFEYEKFENAKHYVSAKGTQDLVISRFDSEQYGEAYMFVNFAKNNGKTNIIDVTLKDCSTVAVYGGEGYTGTPKIIELDDKGLLKLEFAYGEGAFVTPIE